jgi:hypothetical protein
MKSRQITVETSSRDVRVRVVRLDEDGLPGIEEWHDECGALSKGAEQGNLEATFRDTCSLDPLEILEDVVEEYAVVEDASHVHLKLGGEEWHVKFPTPVEEHDLKRRLVQMLLDAYKLAGS